MVKAKISNLKENEDKLRIWRATKVNKRQPRQIKENRQNRNQETSNGKPSQMKINKGLGRRTRACGLLKLEKIQVHIGCQLLVIHHLVFRR